MPTYVYQNPQGEIIEKHFPFGEAPAKIGKYERVISFPSNILFKGPGWAKAAKEPHKVSWDQVDKIMGEADKRAAENEKKRAKGIKNRLLDSM